MTKPEMPERIYASGQCTRLLDDAFWDVADHDEATEYIRTDLARAQIRREVVEEFTMLLSDHAFIADGLDTLLPIAVVRMESVEHVSKVLLTEQEAEDNE